MVLCGSALSAVFGNKSISKPSAGRGRLSASSTSFMVCSAEAQGAFDGLFPSCILGLQELGLLLVVHTMHTRPPAPLHLRRAENILQNRNEQPLQWYRLLGVGMQPRSWKGGKKQLVLLPAPILLWAAWLGCRRCQLVPLPPALVLAVPITPCVCCARSALLA